MKQDYTPMQMELAYFVRRSIYLTVGIGLVFFAIGFLIGNPLWINLIFAIGIIVANVPEGLLPTVTLALTQSSVKMGKENAVVKQTLSVETLVVPPSSVPTRPAPWENRVTGKTG